MLAQVARKHARHLRQILPRGISVYDSQIFSFASPIFRVLVLDGCFVYQPNSSFRQLERWYASPTVRSPARPSRFPARPFVHQPDLFVSQPGIFRSAAPSSDHGTRRPQPDGGNVLRPNNMSHPSAHLVPYPAPRLLRSLQSPTLPAVRSGFHKNRRVLHPFSWHTLTLTLPLTLFAGATHCCDLTVSAKPGSCMSMSLSVCASTCCRKHVLIVQHPKVEKTSGKKLLHKNAVHYPRYKKVFPEKTSRSGRSIH